MRRVFITFRKGISNCVCHLVFFYFESRMYIIGEAFDAFVTNYINNVTLPNPSLFNITLVNITLVVTLVLIFTYLGIY